MIVSIVTPVLNGGSYFAKCIESVAREREACRAKGLDIDVEHIISDGGSTDGSVEVARSYGLEVRREPETALFERINRASFDARGNLVGLIGADDLMLEGAIEAVVAAHRQTGRRWIIGAHHWIDCNADFLGTLSAPPRWIGPSTQACMGWTSASPMATYFVHEFFRDLGGYRSRYRISSDYDLFLRAFVREPFARIDLPLAAWRRTGTTYSHVMKDVIETEASTIAEEFGPKNRALRYASRVAIKTWTNLSNPSWTAGKTMERVRLRLGVQKVSYYT